VLLKLGLGKVVWQIIWRRQMEALLQYLISSEEKSFFVILRALFGVMAMGLIQPLTEMSTRNLLGGQVWPAES
jgi:hypothetical protein